MDFKTEGERIFFEYLTSRLLDIEKDISVAGKGIDYLLRTNVGDVYCLVADVGETDHKGMLKTMYLQLLAQSHLYSPKFTERVENELRRLQDVPPGPAAVSFDPALSIKQKLEEKVKQIEPVAGKSPTVLVIYDSGYRPGDADLLVRQSADDDRLFTASRFTGFSAIAILKEATDSGKNIPRLRVYPNPHALCKLPDGVFSGPADVTVQCASLWELPIQSTSTIPGAGVSRA